MDFTSITTFISSVGFPIACCLYLIYTQKETQRHNMEEIEKLRETVENNTNVMVRLCEKLGIEGDD